METKTVMEEKIKASKSWEEYISEGMIAREQKDTGQWTLGDLATNLTVEYGENTIGKFGYAIGVERKTLLNYRTVAERFEKLVREKYRKLSFSHFATLTGTQKPEAWLEKADDEEWSVETLRKQLKEAYPKVEQPGLDDDPPIAYKCPECGRWRLKDISSFEICRGHYEITSHGMEYH